MEWFNSTVATKKVAKIDKIAFCEFNMNTITVEKKVSDSMIRSELDYLIYNDSAEHVNLIWNGNPLKYLKIVTVYKPFEN